jgi:soluble lytic murein transglycosylase
LKIQLIFLFIVSSWLWIAAAQTRLMNCDTLLEKARDKKFSLRGLAGLRAARLCPDFSFESTELSELEKKIFAAEIALLPQPQEPSATKPALPPSPTLSERIKAEKNPAEKLILYKQFRADLKKLQQKEKHLKVTDEMYRWALQHFKKNSREPTAYSVYYEAAQLAIRSYWTENKLDRTNKLLQESLNRLKKKHSVAELLFLKGRIAEEEKKYEAAVEAYRQTELDIKKHSPASLSFSADRLAWLKAWILYKEKKYPEAESALGQLADNTTDLSEKSRALFYKARCLKHLKAPELAKKSLQQIIEQDFFGYYSLVAYRELGKKFPPLNSYQTNNMFKLSEELDFLPTPERDLFTDLGKYEELELAEKMIWVLARPPLEELALTIHLAQKYQTYMPLFRTFSKLDNEHKLNVFLSYPDLIFPRPHEELVRTISTKTQLRPALIYSIMKQESGFNPRARSTADAFGLMQVIPPLAERLAKKFDIPYTGPADLYKPEINIPLGSLELMNQVEKQQGQLSFVAAAYNAGPEALRHWRQHRVRDDIVEFIEEIPYEETRTYVKLITRNLLFYERVSKRDTEHAFPEDFLNRL